MKKRFILLIDLSDDSAHLIRYVWDWSQQLNADLHLVHQTEVLLPVLADDASRASVVSHANEEASLRITQLIGATLPTSGNVSYTVSDDPIQRTLKKLLAEPYDQLIFVGLKRAGFLKQIFIGSMAIQVIDKVKNIVVAMPTAMSHFSYESIYVAVTEKHPLNILALNKFLGFIDEGKTAITFFHLSKPTDRTVNIEKQLRGLAQLFSSRYRTSYAIYQGSGAFNDIRKVINNTIDELLIVQRGSRHLTDQIFRKFLINELVFEGETPLIVLP